MVRRRHDSYSWSMESRDMEARGSLPRRANAAFALAAMILVVTGGVSVWSNLRSGEAARHRRESFVRRSEVARLLGDLQNAETSQRGYLLTGDRRFLEPYQK